METFRWIEWNVEHIAEHGVTPEEAEWVARHPVAGFLRKQRGGYLAWGQTPAGRWLQVAYRRESTPSGTECFIYHARPLDADEKRRSNR
jgi:hypothetical protein